jgi:Ca2+-binding RTX toxin-like protein
LLAVLTAAAGLALPTGVAAASTVSADPPGTPAVFESGLAASDVTSQLVAFNTVQFKDAAQALAAGTGCAAGPPVACAAMDQDLRFGPMSDRFRGFSLARITISGGGGSDTIRTAGSRNLVSAGGGDDMVWENGNSGGTVKGDAGDDKLYTFEAEADLQGGTGDDLLVTRSARLGNQLAGGDGDDELVAMSPGTGALAGGGGNDVIVLDTPFGGFSADGGGGSDTVAGSSGADQVAGGAGSDLIDVSGDGPGDSVDCGTGIDVAFYDAGDVVSRSCELRLHGPAPANPRVTAARADANAFIAAMPAIPAF